MESQPGVRQLLEEESPVVSPSDATPSDPQPQAGTSDAPATGANVDEVVQPTAELSPKAPDEEPARVPEPEAPPSVPHASGPLVDEQALARTVETLRAEADSLEKLLAQVRYDKARLEKQEHELCQARAAKQQAEQEATSHAAKLRAAETDLQQARAAGDATKTQLYSQQQRTADLESYLEATKTELDRTTAELATLRTQVEALQLRVTANAEARLQELRSRISTGALKARRQVPDKLSTPTADEGTIVLSRFYELLSALEQNGIKVEP
jgi:predicted  nucleic acid-binding Zn-ribbon protein